MRACACVCAEVGVGSLGNKETIQKSKQIYPTYSGLKIRTALSNLKAQTIFVKC